MALPEAFTRWNPKAHLHPIDRLAPYYFWWVIKARVVKKTGVKTCRSSLGHFRLFSLTLVDQSGSIRVMAAKGNVDKYYDLLEVDKVYFVSNAHIKKFDAKIPSTTGHFYEMVLRRNTVIELCPEDDASIPIAPALDFTPFSELENLGVHDYVNVIGVCKAYTALKTSICTTTQKEIRRGAVRIVDESKKEVSVILFDDEAERFNAENNSVVVFEGVQMFRCVGGVALNMSLLGSLTINPSIERAHVLHGWFEREGKNAQCLSLSRKRAPLALSLTEIKKLDLGESGKVEHVECVARFVGVFKGNALFKGCPTGGCTKSVTAVDGETYRCEGCNIDTLVFKWRYRLLFTLEDSTDSLEAICFHDAGEMILGKKADELAAIMLEDTERYELTLSELPVGEFVFRMTVRMLSYNDVVHLCPVVLSATPVQPHA